MNANTTPNLSEFITFKPQKFNDTYEVTLAFNEQLIATYSMSVKFMGYKKKLSVIELNRTKEIINAAATVQNNATELAKKCGEILYPVELLADEQANIVGINNHKIIIDRWLYNSPALFAYFPEEVAENYLKQTAQIIQEPNALLAVLQRDFFVTAYFTPFIRYINTAILTRKFYLPIPVTIQIEQVATKIENDPDCYMVTATGKAVQSAEIEFSINANYTLNKHTNNLAYATFSVQTINDNNLSKTMVQIELKN